MGNGVLDSDHIRALINMADNLDVSGQRTDAITLRAIATRYGPRRPCPAVMRWNPPYAPSTHVDFTCTGEVDHTGSHGHELAGVNAARASLIWDDK